MNTTIVNTQTEAERQKVLDTLVKETVNDPRLKVWIIGDDGTKLLLLPDGAERDALVKVIPGMTKETDVITITDIQAIELGLL